MEATAGQLRERIMDLRAVTIGDDNAESASQTESTRGSDVELMNSLKEQLDHLQQDMERLGEIDPAEVFTTAQYGALVITDKRNFLIGTSLEEFDVDGKPFLGVTVKAPLIQSMLGKKAGDKVMFNEVTYTIKSIN